ncbi:MAG: hypothetical protein H0X66_00745 [Verrucomicrobia bacterium]|nr:hypothetical protein [Verrucomicrobiota bacterium]
MTAQWKENPIDGPWVAPSVQTREFERAYFAGMMDSVVTTETDWTFAYGTRRAASDIAASIQRYLKELGYFDRWPESQSSSDGYRERLAPFTFHIVSIDPTAVMMVPHDFGDPKGNRSIVDIVGWPPKQSFSSRYMLNHIEYGPTLPYHPEVLWFSPDLRVPPTRLTSHTESEQRLSHKRINLIVRKKGESWITTREP